MKVKYGLWNGGLVSPAPAPARHVILLLGIALLTGLALVGPVAAQDNETASGNATNETAGGETTTGAAGGSSDLGVPADAPAPAEGKITRVLTFGAIEAPGPCPGGAPAPCYDVLTLVANPGDTVVLHGNWPNEAAAHNIHITEGVEGNLKSGPPSSGLHTLAFTMPESGKVKFICDAHSATMVVDVVTPEAAASAGGHESVPTLGVHFLAYWVGVIAFAILFVVYGLTFFLFKYNETRATTDHWDRSENPGESKRLAAIAPLLAIVIAVAAIAAIVYVVMR